MARRYKTWSGAQATTAPIAVIATGTATKTLLQLSTAAGQRIRLISWGYTLDTKPGAAGAMELIDVDVASSVGTAHVAAGIFPIDGQEATASALTLGTANTGYNFGTLGTPTTSRTLDLVTLSTTSAEAAPFLTYSYQFVPDERDIIAASRFCQVRATTPTTGVNARCWIAYEEGF